MKIAVFVDHFPSNTQTFVLHQILGIATSGHELTILSRRKGKSNTAPSPLIKQHKLMERIVHLPPNPDTTLGKALTVLSSFKSFTGMFLLVRIVYLRVAQRGLGGNSFITWLSDALFLSHNKFRFDIVHAQFGMLGAYAERLRHIGALNGKIITSFRGYDTIKHLNIYPGDYRFLVKNGDGFLPVCQYFKDWLIENNCSASRIFVLRSGIDLNSLSFKPSAFADQESSIELIAIGRFVEKKGFEYLVDAIGILAREKARNFHLSIVGDGPNKELLLNKIRNQGLEQHVSLVGLLTHSDLLQKLAESHAILVPSITASDGDQEGIPNVAKEAMALGTPVIASRHSGTPELITDKETGLLVPERDADAIAKALEYLIKNPNEVSAMRDRARHKVESEYDIRALNADLIAYYEKIASR
ncbi:MAG: glycosyltransferase [Pseudomonadota bacterium]